MTDVRITTCGADDAAVAARVLADVVGGTAAAVHLKGVLADPDVILCVATAEGASAGIAYGYVYPELTGPRRAALLYEVDVAAAFRRRGVGTALMGAFAAACRERGAPTYWLVTDHGNTPAMALYAKTGGVLSATDDAMFRFGRAVRTGESPPEPAVREETGA